MIRIRDLSLTPDDNMSRLAQLAAKHLMVKESEIKHLHIRKKSWFWFSVLHVLPVQSPFHTALYISSLSHLLLKRISGR